jgi:hypothetical protein
MGSEDCENGDGLRGVRGAIGGGFPRFEAPTRR